MRTRSSSAAMPEPAPRAWSEIAERALAGDAVALAELSRLITGCLCRLRAYDFRDEWDDLRQEVLVALLASHRQGRLRDAQAFVGYVRIITRNKFCDRLRRELDWRERDALPWEELAARLPIASEPAPDPARGELWRAVGELPDEQRRAVELVYGEGYSVEEVSQRDGVPLGTQKRRLRQALAALRLRLGGATR